MIDSDEISAPASQLERYTWALAVLWTGVVAASLMWNVVQGRQRTLEVARIQARSAYEKDIIYRRWNTMHGGVYVPVTDETQPNPYLDVPDREITTPTGKELTLMNPAYMTREVHALAEEQVGVRGHITSLNPIRPENAADPWETEALKAFERGESEASSLEKVEGIEYMRLMRPLTTERGCLKCHAAQGYEEGDIRGGISVSVPMEPLWAVARARMVVLATSHLLPWVMGLAGIVLPMRRLSQSDRERRAAELELETSAQELEAFTYSVSHDLRAPLRAMEGFSQSLLEDYADRLDPVGQDYARRIVGGAQRMDILIQDLLAYSRLSQVEMTLRPVGLEGVVQKVLSLLTSEIQEKSAQVAVERPLPRVVGHQATLVRMVENLLSNALKFVAPDVQPQVRVWAETIPTTRPADHPTTLVRLWVEDNGIGIASEHHERIFRIFERLHGVETYPGTGVGLAIVRKGMERMGGRVGVESEPGLGSRFWVQLPRSKT